MFLEDLSQSSQSRSVGFDEKHDFLAMRDFLLPPIPGVDLREDVDAGGGLFLEDETGEFPSLADRGGGD